MHNREKISKHRIHISYNGIIYKGEHQNRSAKIFWYKIVNDKPSVMYTDTICIKHYLRFIVVSVILNTRKWNSLNLKKTSFSEIINKT